eukprot:COSAG04_NODE_4795_length_1890_cov_1.524846_1_plen_131_part_10
MKPPMQPLREMICKSRSKFPRNSAAARRAPPAAAQQGATQQHRRDWHCASRLSAQWPPATPCQPLILSPMAPLSLLSLAQLGAVGVVAAAVPPAAEPVELVPTPFGLRPKQCVVEVPDGAHVDEDETGLVL